jgi:hypothetical protein
MHSKTAQRVVTLPREAKEAAACSRDPALSFLQTPAIKDEQQQREEHQQENR